MTDKDKELLELAAKAAGIKGEYFDETSSGGAGIRESELSPLNWNPLTDEGDALRLAVKLKLEINTDWYNCDACWYTGKAIVASAEGVKEEPHNGDEFAATRRAIVRAAAEVGMGITQPMVEGLPEDNYDKTQAEAFTLAERERCAKLVEELAREYRYNGLSAWTIASEIRKEPK